MVIRIAVVTLLAFGFAVATPASATTRTVTVQGHMFVNGTITVVQGDSVRWYFNDGGIPHTTTSFQGFWSSGTKYAGQSFTRAFPFAGAFGYYCKFHTSMTGRITVPLRVSGSPSTGYRLTWSAATTTPTNRSFDVQVRRPGSTTWVNLRQNTTTKTLFYNPATNGTYSFRARTDNKTSGQSSGWTPLVTRTIS